MLRRPKVKFRRLRLLVPCLILMLVTPAAARSP